MADIAVPVGAAPGTKRRRRSILCGHCNRSVSSSTYYRHRELFFDVVSQQWQRHEDSFLGLPEQHEDGEESRTVHAGMNMML